MVDKASGNGSGIVPVNGFTSRFGNGYHIYRKEETGRSRKVVLGLGNLLSGDEGAGIHALAYLRSAIGRHAQVEWIDGGILGLNLLPLIRNCSHLLVIDAADAGRPPGQLIEIDQDRLLIFHGVKLSEHQVTFQEVLGLATMLGRAPERMHLIGVQPACLEPGTKLSPPVAAAMPEVSRRVRAILESWGLVEPAS